MPEKKPSAVSTDSTPINLGDSIRGELVLPPTAAQQSFDSLSNALDLFDAEAEEPAAHQNDPPPAMSLR